MKVLNGFRKAKLITTAIGFIVIGAILAVTSVMGINKDKNSGAVYQEAQAVISSITSERVKVGADDYNDEYTVLVDYTVDGKTYTGVQYGAYNSSMKEGGTVTILYDTADPSVIRAPGSGKVPYILLAVGCAAVVAGLLLMIKAAKTKVADMNEYDRVDMSAVTPEDAAAVESSTEEQSRYIFHFDKHLKQGYVMETEDGRVVYEGKMQKMTALKPYVFEFINHLTARHFTREIGHTVSWSAGSGSGFAAQVPITRQFTVDGQSNWDFLASHGYSFDMVMEGIAVCFRVKYYGAQVAYLKTVGTNAVTKKNYAVGEMPVNGIYEVTCRDSDLDMIFMVCMSVARAIFYEK